MANREFKIELDNVEMINGSDDLLKDTKVTKVTLTGENKLNSLNSTFENCTELTVIEGDINLDGVSDMTEMTLNTPLDEVKVTNPTQETIQATNSLKQATNVKIGGTKYSKGGVQDVVGSLEWNAENFTYEDTILENVYTNSSSIEESKNITVSNTLEQKVTSIEITGQTYENLVNGKATKNLLDEMSMQQTEGSPTQFTPHMEQPICLEYIEGQTYQNLVDGKGEETLISEYSPVINDFVPNTFEPPQNQLICLESMEGETYQNLIKGKSEYKLTDAYSHTWTEENNKLENMPNAVEIPEIWGNTIQGYANVINAKQIVDSINNSGAGTATSDSTNTELFSVSNHTPNNPTNSDNFIQLKPNTKYSVACYNSNYNYKQYITYFLGNNPTSAAGSTNSSPTITTDSSGKVLFYPPGVQGQKVCIRCVEGEYPLHLWTYDTLDLNYIQSVGDLYVDKEDNPILDEDGNKQYKLEIFSDNNINLVDPNGWIPDPTNSKNLIQTIKLDPNAIYTYYGNQSSTQSSWHGVKFIDSNENELKLIYSEHCSIKRINTFTTDSNPNVYLRLYWGETNTVNHINTVLLPMLVRGSKVLPYIEGTGNNQSNKTTILMPQPLRRVNNYSNYGDVPIMDELIYIDNKYYIKQRIDTVDLTNATIKTSTTASDASRKIISLGINKSYTQSAGSKNIVLRAFCEGFTFTDNAYSATSDSFEYYTGKDYLTFNVSANTTDEMFLERLAQTNAKLYIPLGGSTYTNDAWNHPYNLIETKILEKPSLETYSPKTYLTTNTEVQPSQMSITNKEVKFIPLSLQPSKSYTVQLDSVGKDNKPITVNLGGATTTIQPTNDTSKHHRVSITTPSSLTTDNLDLSGEGVIVNDVMLFEGNTSEIKQDVDYMDGIQSIGELFESRNLFDYTQSEVGLLETTNGNISDDNSWKYTTDFISVKPNTTYCISQTSGLGFYYKIVEYNSSQSYLKGTSLENSVGNNNNRDYNTFTTSSTTYYIRLGWEVSTFEIQLEEGLIPTEFMEFDSEKYRIEIEIYDSRWDNI